MNLHPCKLKTLAAIMAFTGAALFSPAAQATVLLFDQTRDTATHTTVLPTFSGAGMEPDYGDRVAGRTQAVTGGQFTYGEAGEGFTPNVVVDYSSGATAPAAGVSLWQSDYGDLQNVAFGPRASGMLVIGLNADPGFEVLLHGFDLAGWSRTDYTIRGVRVFDGSLLLQERRDVLVEGDAVGPAHSSLAFADAVRGSRLRIEIDYGNLAAGQQDNIGIDNLRFGQSPPPLPAVPELPSALLLLAGGAVLGLRQRRAGF